MTPSEDDRSFAHTLSMPVSTENQNSAIMVMRPAEENVPMVCG
jgi:hypothetical protein